MELKSVQMKLRIGSFIASTIILINVSVALSAKTYVGSKQCGECHQEEYESYKKYAKKAHSFKAVEKMMDKLTRQELEKCYSCHTTGYGRPGGFKDEKTTPELKNVGCEVCHGPGSKHIETEDIADIWAEADEIKKVCNNCHTKERVDSFNFKPLLHGGAH